MNCLINQGVVLQLNPIFHSSIPIFVFAPILNNPMIPAPPFLLNRQNADRLPVGYETGQISIVTSIAGFF
jgi:hypothetical protein